MSGFNPNPALAGGIGLVSQAALDKVAIDATSRLAKRKAKKGGKGKRRKAIA